jgi:hypothetical protein
MFSCDGEPALRVYHKMNMTVPPRRQNVSALIGRCDNDAQGVMLDDLVVVDLRHQLRVVNNRFV